MKRQSKRQTSISEYFKKSKPDSSQSTHISSPGNSPSSSQVNTHSSDQEDEPASAQNSSSDRDDRDVEPLSPETLSSDPEDLEDEQSFELGDQVNGPLSAVTLTSDPEDQLDEQSSDLDDEENKQSSDPHTEKDEQSSVEKLASETEDKTYSDDFGTEDSSTSATVNDNIPSCAWTIYKIDNECIESEEDIQNIEQLCIVLDRLLTRARLEERTVTHDICGSYKLLHYVFLETKDENIITTQVERHRGTDEEDTTPLPGNRTSGNVLVYCRLHDSETKGEKVPEVFLLCQGKHFSSIVGLIDPSIRLPIARTFIDGKKIKGYETKSIAGLALTDKVTFKDYINISLSTASPFTDVYVSSITGLIKTNSDLYQLVREPNACNKGEQIALTVGHNFVRVEKKLSYKTSAKICRFFSEIQCTNPNDSESLPILDALEYVQRLPTKDSYCTIMFNKLSIDVLSGKSYNSDFYLSDSVSQHWLNSSEFTLFDCKDKTGPYEIWNWSSAPSLIEVIERLKKTYKTEETIRHNLEKKTIKLSYSSPFTESKNPRPLQNFVHGCLDTEKGLFVKIEKKWFKASSLFSQIVDNRFCECILKHTVLKDKDIKRLIKYPWCTTKKTFSVQDFRDFVEVLKMESAEKIFAILQNQIKLTNSTGKHLLTKGSCIIPKSSRLSSIITTKLKQSSFDHSSTSNTNHNESSHDNRKNIQGQVRKVLLDNQNGDLLKSVGDLQIIKEVDNGNGRFQVENVFITDEVMRNINDIDPTIQDTEILKFLRSMSALNEDEYNELYLLSTPRDDRFFVLPGDKITPNDIELFDVLIRDTRKNRTYLFQNKKGFDHVTRDACGQLRNSADVLWHDLMNGRRTHIELFWKMATSDTADSVYRKLLKEKLEELGKDKFIEAFDSKAVIVFVLSIALPGSRKSALMSEVRPITKQLLRENDLKADFLQPLKNIGLLNSRGFLTDTFIGLNKEGFVKKM